MLKKKSAFQLILVWERRIFQMADTLPEFLPRIWKILKSFIKRQLSLIFKVSLNTYVFMLKKKTVLQLLLVWERRFFEIPDALPEFLHKFKNYKN